jgi:hypothetical protein
MPPIQRLKTHFTTFQHNRLNIHTKKSHSPSTANTRRRAPRGNEFSSVIYLTENCSNYSASDAKIIATKLYSNALNSCLPTFVSPPNFPPPLPIPTPTFYFRNIFHHRHFHTQTTLSHDATPLHGDAKKVLLSTRQRFMLRPASVSSPGKPTMHSPGFPALNKTHNAHAARDPTHATVAQNYWKRSETCCPE